jgi:CubicO group peptidase (beta-lactamase class C family)
VNEALHAAESSLPGTIPLINAGMAGGLHVGAQLYVSLRGQVVADVALGEARPAVSMRSDTLVPWMSSTKPVAAVAIAQLRERGLIAFGDPVARHIREFGANGKDVITVRHLLTHTAGIRAFPGDWESQDWDATIHNICAGRIEPDWTVGEKAGYHVATSWYILGELVRRLDGRQYRDYVREAIFQPLGMNNCWIGMTAESYRAYGERMAIMPDTSKGPPKFELPENDMTGAMQGRPGGGGRGPMRELGQFYEMLLNGGAIPTNNSRLLASDSVRELTSPQRVGMYDHTFRHVMDWGLGFIMNSARYGIDTVPYNYSRHASAETFGHSGSQSSSAFADPKHGLAVAIMWNGMPGEPKHQIRQRQTLTALYEDLGLA